MFPISLILRGYHTLDIRLVNQTCSTFKESEFMTSNRSGDSPAEVECPEITFVTETPKCKNDLH